MGGGETDLGARAEELDLGAKVAQWHAWLDEHPEPAWKETGTTAYLLEQLEPLDATVHTQEDRTGAIVELGDGPRWIGLRADLDAIWMGDEDGYAVHSCGHSAHMAIVLGAAHLLAGRVPEGVGVRLLLQPAEEPGTGAADLIERGALEGMSHLFGMHLRPAEELDNGWFAPALHSGASETGRVTIVGQDAHGARPHQGANAIDPLVALHQVLPRLRFAPSESYSAKITRIRAGGSSTNVIPGRAECAIDIRAQRNEVLEQLHERIDQAAAGIATTYGVDIEIGWSEHTPGAEVHPEAAKLLRAAIVEVAGEERLAEEIVTPGADDFHIYSYGRPELRTAMLAVGVGLTPGLHHPEVTYATEALPVAAQILARAVLAAAQAEVG
ncbi:amidohydrolase [Ornithinimicrobium panacihumi]|uniref:amidohydrolase n=1 Tax=Ornithinimicrobium panacihumi TaxID=2008449 RepID=UPI003F887C31